MGLRGLVGISKTYKLIGSITKSGRRIESNGSIIKTYTNWELDLYKSFINYNDPPFEKHGIESYVLHSAVIPLNERIKVEEEKVLPIFDSFNSKNYSLLELKRDDIIYVYSYDRVRQRFREMIAEKRNHFLQIQQKQELAQQQQLKIRKSSTQEEYRNFVRGEVNSLSGDVFFTSRSHQITESIDHLKSFFQRCFDKELQNNRHQEVKVYNPAIGGYENMSYHHLAFMKGEELAAIKEIIVTRLTSHWKNSLSYTYGDEFNGIHLNTYDF